MCIRDRLIAVNLTPWNIAKVTPVLWHNPWANHPLLPDTWQIPQLIPDKKDNCLLKKDGKSTWKMLGLHPKWPFNK